MKGAIIHLAAGGTGGHVFPALAVAEALKVKGFEPHLLTDQRGAAVLAGIENLPFKIHVLSAASPFQRGMFRRAIALGKLLFGALNACVLIGVTRPRVMIGFGGYPSFAPLFMARLFGLPTMVHEQNAYLGRANKLIATKSCLLALSWPKTTNLPDNVSVHVTGMPVRDAFFAKRHQNKDGQKLVLTVLGGSQGAEILGQLVPDALAMVEPPLRERIEICQQARPEQVGALRLRYNALGMTANISSFYKDMPTLLARSDLVICRSGASSIAELAAIGRASLMMPLPSAMDNHQRANAIQMEQVGGGYCLDETTISPAFLATQIVQMFEKTETLRTMAKNATALASPNAAHDIATLAIGLIKTRQCSVTGRIA